MATTPPLSGKERPPVPLAAAGVSPEKASAGEPGLSPLFVTNLLAILAVGVAFCGWILYYTEWFPAIGGILALGGVLSWLAFVSKILQDDRTKAIQTWADRAILCSRITLGVLVLVTAFGLLAASFLGTVQVESIRESTDRFLRLHPAGSPGGEDERLRPGEAVRRPVWTSFWNPAVWRVKVSGYPDELVTVKPWRRQTLSVPSSFERPVVLLRPTVDLFDAVHNSPRRLAIRVASPASPGSPSPRRSRDLTAEADGQPLEFDGVPIWVGCDEDVAIPLRLEAAWRAELGVHQRASMINYWLHPRALPGERLALEIGSEVVVTLLDQEGNKSEQKFIVRKQSDFLQEEKLELDRP